jgi:hypothetical protein
LSTLVIEVASSPVRKADWSTLGRWLARKSKATMPGAAPEVALMPRIVITRAQV